eukprot:TRINITY_DN331_c2_g1_i6.p1 TRINITY_DN331_c2_g1~~TRINITY_DN331_c2_g1_i6.p1  ORF type:complete len:456 (+),score=124.53 TRINITY_DN331_c2_g1_i6:184-1551(+)
MMKPCTCIHVIVFPRLLTCFLCFMDGISGNSRVVLRPKTTEHVSKILKYCNERRLPVVPQGGNTCLVGGSVPVKDEIILSLNSMNSIRSFDPHAGVLTCDAGCVLENLEVFLAEKDHIMPIDLGAKGSCHIGGNVAANAGGLRLLRYGSLHGSLLGLEVVLADGTVLNEMSTLRKDNTGYDLKQLFIGSEGTLGVITGVSILTPPKSNAMNVVFLSCDSYDQVLRTLEMAKKRLGEVMSAFEFLDDDALGSVLGHMSNLVCPVEERRSFYVVIETSGSNKDHDEEKLMAFLEEVMGDGIIADGVLAQSETQFKDIWALRESISESLNKKGAVYKYDVSLPQSRMYDLVEDIRKRVGSQSLITCGYGHIGDGNLHLNVVFPSFEKKHEEILEPFVYEWVSKEHGSVSAEHGIGYMKPKVLHHSKTWESIRVMKTIKDALDPNGILNPWKVLPEKIQ